MLLIVVSETIDQCVEVDSVVSILGHLFLRGEILWFISLRQAVLCLTTVGLPGDNKSHT